MVLIPSGFEGAGGGHGKPTIGMPWYCRAAKWMTGRLPSSPARSFLTRWCGHDADDAHNISAGSLSSIG
jgi:hypothetical protein